MRGLICALVLLSCFAAAQGKSAAAKGKSAAAPNQATIEKAWADFEKKDAAAVGGILADDAIEIWADGKGPHDKKSTLEGMHSMNIEKYSLSDFKFTILGGRVELADYRANVKFKGAAQEYKLLVSEVWEKRGADWKLVHYQETEVK
jgi:ketosteroid isomerase-like protein